MINKINAQPSTFLVLHNVEKKGLTLFGNKIWG